MNIGKRKNIRSQFYTSFTKEYKIFITKFNDVIFQLKEFFFFWKERITVGICLIPCLDNSEETLGHRRYIINLKKNSLIIFGPKNLYVLQTLTGGGKNGKTIGIITKHTTGFLHSFFFFIFSSFFFSFF